MTQLLILSTVCGGGAGGSYEIEGYAEIDVQQLTTYIDALIAGDEDVSDKLGWALEDLATGCTMDWAYDNLAEWNEMLKKLAADEMVVVDGIESVVVFAPVVSDLKSTRKAAGAKMSELMNTDDHPWDDEDELD